MVPLVLLWVWKAGTLLPAVLLGVSLRANQINTQSEKGQHDSTGWSVPPASSSPRAANRHSFGRVFKNLPPDFETMAMSLFSHFHYRIRGFRSFVLPTFVFHLLSQMISPKLSVNSTLGVYVTFRQKSSLRRRAVYSDGIASL